MTWDSGDVVFWYVVVATTAIVVWTVAVYVIESRRAGSSPWSEWYNDRVVPLYRARRRPSKARPAAHGSPPPSSRPRSRHVRRAA